jgi:hypothetical protein
MVDLNELGVEGNGSSIRATTYGGSYIREMRRALDSFSPREVNNVLEGGRGLNTQAFAHYVDNVWNTSFFLGIDKHPARDSIFGGLDVRIR